MIRSHFSADCDFGHIKMSNHPPTSTPSLSTGGAARLTVDLLSPSMSSISSISSSPSFEITPGSSVNPQSAMSLSTLSNASNPLPQSQSQSQSHAHHVTSASGTSLSISTFSSPTSNVFPPPLSSTSASALAAQLALAVPTPTPVASQVEKDQQVHLELKLLMNENWEYTPLFEPLTVEMSRDEYTWSTLLHLQPLLLGLNDTTGPTVPVAANAATAASANQHDKKINREEEEDDEEEEEDEEDDLDRMDDNSIDMFDPFAASKPKLNPQSNTALASISSPIPNPSSVSSSSANLLDCLPPNQQRAFRVFHLCIHHYLIHCQTHAPIAQPRSGDSIALFLLGTLTKCATDSISNPNTSGRYTALALIDLLEYVGKSCKLRCSLNKLFQLMQTTPSKLELPANTTTPVAAEIVRLASKYSGVGHKLLQLQHQQDFGSNSSPRAVSSNASTSSSSDSSSSASSSMSSDLAIFSPHLSSASYAEPLFATYHSDAVSILNKWNVRPHYIRMLTRILGDNVATTPTTITSSSSSASSFASSHVPSSHLNVIPSAWYQFTDTPIFPRISGSLSSIPSASASSSTPSTAPSVGYTWTCWLSLSENKSADTPKNVFQFFNETGYGMQAYVKGNQLGVRSLPTTSDQIVLKNFAFQTEKWVYITVTHRPMPQQHQQQTQEEGGEKQQASGGKGKPVAAPVGSASTSAQTRALSKSGAAASISSSSSAASSALSSPSPRPAKLTLYINGERVSSHDIPFPSVDHSDSLQCTLGGFCGRMGSFHFFSDVLNSSVIYSLYTLGGGNYAIPAHHIVNTGLVAVFSPPPSCTAQTVTQAAVAAAATAAASSSSASSTSSSTNPASPGHAHPVPVNHRIVSRVLLSQSPYQTTQTICLPGAWPEASNDASSPFPSTAAFTSFSAASAAVRCSQHTLRLDGVSVVQRVNNGQSFVDLGGLRLLFYNTSPVYSGTQFKSDEEISELLILLSQLILTNEQSAHLLVEMGSIAIKNFFSIIFERNIVQWYYYMV